MSAARIDHVGESRACEEAALSIMRTQSLGIRPDADAQLQLALAQLHATLALVEQQRVANLLLLIKPENPREFDTWDEIAEALRLRP